MRTGLGEVIADHREEEKRGQSRDSVVVDAYFHWYSNLDRFVSHNRRWDDCFKIQRARFARAMFNS